MRPVRIRRSHSSLLQQPQKSQIEGHQICRLTQAALGPGRRVAVGRDTRLPTWLSIHAGWSDASTSASTFTRIYSFLSFIYITIYAAEEIFQQVAKW